MNSLKNHGFREVKKQLRHRIKSNGLDTIDVQVTREHGKHKIVFTGSPEQVIQAEKILADWG